ncbi:STAGA complex 65 subunit gamma-like [Pollicipes pollicipes]|uniref:STAGA complex 65 subunit gamma-like n=1 Tax=Pollicipes pollicipes TaxID=41117 RepID=UPI001884A514|nr:STAGA complex 65 subunit gamma-like [Pollicipes pollicipes]XP_037087172.1 STAGA complex 65 subunit gamma-like [Pollicipes pollicipes]XP_037087173.1 STAGA complex 65 subunit gamma-like [Pollicipes pollicipes]XP_037087174.1 STAGA complex 65 subunit gamma-like [Pollicipes pollicipes]
MVTMTTQHWGEFESSTQHVEGLRPEELSKLTKLQQSIVVEGPKLFQPAEVPQEHDTRSQQAFRMDPLVLATIQLESQNAAISQAVAQGTAVDESALVPLSISDCLTKLEETFTVFPEVKDSHFASGRGSPVPEIAPELCRDLLVRSVGTLAAHAGFHTSSDLVLGVLADAAGSFLSSLCRMLRQTRDMEAERGSHGFVDALERTFVDSGAGSLRHLVSYYATSVVERLRQVRDTNYQLRAEYDQLASDRESVENITLDDSLLVDILAETADRPALCRARGNYRHVGVPQHELRVGR